MTSKNPKRALITGILGQDGTYLSLFLLKKGYKIFGIDARSENNQPRVALERCDITNGNDLESLILKIQPHEIYNLAAVSSRADAKENPQRADEINHLAVVGLLKAIKKVDKNIRLFQASSGLIFGEGTSKKIQTETTKHNPRGVYAKTKARAHRAVQKYRTNNGLFCCNGILFNHESPLRDEQMLTRKISKGVAQIKMGKREKITLLRDGGSRDWGYAKEYVEAMWLMLQQSNPSDYIIATGENHSVSDVLNTAFNYVGIENWKPFVLFKKQTLEKPRRAIASIAKIRALGWKPKTSFQKVVEMMVEKDLQKIKKII